jgi:hypothetical protein
MAASTALPTTDSRLLSIFYKKTFYFNKREKLKNDEIFVLKIPESYLCKSAKMLKFFTRIAKQV